MDRGCQEDLISLEVLFVDKHFQQIDTYILVVLILYLFKEEIITRNYFSSQELTILQYQSEVPENQSTHIFALNLYLSGLIFYFKLKKGDKDNMKQEPHFLSLLVKNISSICCFIV